MSITYELAMMNFKANHEVTGVFVTDVCGALVRDCSDDETVPVRLQPNTPCGTEALYEFESFAEDDRTCAINETLVIRLLRAIRRA